VQKQEQRQEQKQIPRASRGNDNQKGKCKTKNNGKRRTTARAEGFPGRLDPLGGDSRGGAEAEG
jgi:hypothetical protein